jgi:transcriptional regulator with XRE-family HTH domain
MQKSLLGKNLYLDRYSLGLSQADISRAINVSQQAVARWENGHSIPRYAVLEKLKTFLAEEFKKTNSESLVCSMVDNFIPKPKEQKAKIELRDHFAVKVIPTLIEQYANIVRSKTPQVWDSQWRTFVAEDAYKMADAMLKARK